VVVKVLRPGIHVLVETDIRALSIAIRGLKLWSFLRRRVDLDRLVDEFVTTTRRELDMPAEGRHAERFAQDFADDDAILIPKVFWPTSAKSTLTLENVAYIKFNDTRALEDAGVDRAAVAAKLYDVYLQQIFVHNFVHADPHPGNLFIRPLEDGFQIAFVDFGMVAIVPERLQLALREYVIAIGTRDAYRIVKAYQMAGVLLPGADLKRIEEAHEVIFERFWGVQIGNLSDRAFEEIGPLFTEYRDLIFDNPFQAQVELLFVQRAIEILIGLVTSLDPSFDLWEATRPFAQRLIREGAALPKEEWLSELAAGLKTALTLPAQMGRVLTAAERGNLSVKSTLGSDARRAVLRLERALGRLTGMVAAAGLLVAGSVLYAGETTPSWVGLAAMGLAGGLAVMVLLRRGPF
jgi:predicted unusual protein kinase regulating ubiquinone biosynthesis (AarF/ABC1/UbiB family)